MDICAIQDFIIIIIINNNNNNNNNPSTHLAWAQRRVNQRSEVTVFKVRLPYESRNPLTTTSRKRKLSSPTRRMRRGSGVVPSMKTCRKLDVLFLDTEAQVFLMTSRCSEASTLEGMKMTMSMTMSIAELFG